MQLICGIMRFSGTECIIFLEMELGCGEGGDHAVNKFSE